jgi:high-affinity nickel-transport protein
MNDGMNDWFALLALAFTMGLKHGLDADHLVAIDGLARFQASLPAPRAKRARWCGLWFSFGHGVVVTLAALSAGMLSASFHVPGWIEGLGVLISIGALSLLGLLNLRALWRAPHGQHVHMVGLRADWLSQIVRKGNSASPALLGALFALSFDTMSLATLLALTAARVGGPGNTLALGAAFSLGMIAVDAMNGLWVARLLERADERAARASRWMSAAVAGLSLMVAAYGAAKYLLPAVADWSEGRELMLGLSVVILVGLAFVVATRIHRPSGGAATPATSEGA